jgi:peptidoglycan/xylan/chitin deacetylase (PgdA/CDA1 family)
MVGVSLVLVLIPAAPVGDMPPPIHVTIDGFVRPLPEDVTIETVQQLLHLRARPGSLLDVEGVPLERRAYPGHVRLNDERVTQDAVLEDGDVVVFVDGRDHYEPLEIIERATEEGQVENPQTHLGTTGGKQIITRGATSGKLVSSIFEPSGRSVPRAVALTFDDGPQPTWTLRILRILQDFNVKATFFTIGYRVRTYPEIARQLARAGMALANHTQSHPNSPPFTQLPDNRLRSEMRAGARALEDVVGVEPTVFRPVGGAWNGRILREADALEERTVLWSVDSRDWTGISPDAIVRNVLSAVGPGSIILLHDGGGDSANTVAALPRIIRGIKARGLEFVALD